jgi:ABC-type amino acid transport substrate-binding protein
MKSVAVLLSTLCILVSLSAGANDLDAVLKSKKIRIAVDTTYPPMEFEANDGKVIGLDVDLARALAKILKVEAEFIVMPWDGILAGLQSNRYDIIMSSMNVTPERSQQVNFVPYLSMGQIFVIKKNTAPVKTEADLKGRVIAVQADTTSFNALEEFKKKGIAIKEIKAFKGATETFSALKSNQADTVITDEAVGFYYAGLDNKTFAVSGTAIKPEPIGIAVKKSDAKLLKALTDAVAAIKKNGEYARIYKEWLKTTPKI